MNIFLVGQFPLQSVTNFSTVIRSVSGHSFQCVHIRTTVATICVWSFQAVSLCLAYFLNDFTAFWDNPRNHCDIHSSLNAVFWFHNGYVGKEPVASKKYCMDYWLKRLQERMDRCSSHHDVTKIMLETALNTIQSISEFDPGFCPEIKFFGTNDLLS